MKSSAPTISTFLFCFLKKNTNRILIQLEVRSLGSKFLPSSLFQKTFVCSFCPLSWPMIHFPSHKARWVQKSRECPRLLWSSLPTRARGNSKVMPFMAARWGFPSVTARSQIRYLSKLSCMFIPWSFSSAYKFQWILYLGAFNFSISSTLSFYSYFLTRLGLHDFFHLNQVQFSTSLGQISICQCGSPPLI